MLGFIEVYHEKGEPCFIITNGAATPYGRSGSGAIIEFHDFIDINYYINMYGWTHTHRLVLNVAQIII